MSRRTVGIVMHGVTGRMSSRIVELLEAVQVEQEHPDVAVVTCRPSESICQSVSQHDPVPDAGQRILEGLSE